MNKISRSFQIFSAFLLIILIAGCNRSKIKQEDPIVQEPNVNLEKFCGSFNFRVIKESWDNFNPTTYDTTLYNGTISKYIKSDSKSDLYIDDDDLDEDSTKKLTIKFLNNKIITTIVNSNGVLMTNNGTHYHLEGKFIDSLSIDFALTGLGGLGGGWNYYVTGIKN